MEKANTSTADMVRDAIKTLGERGGSSLHNIKKYIESVYQVDMRYRAPRIRKFLRTAVSDGGIVQTRGRGASGSFKLPPKRTVSSTVRVRGPKTASTRKAVSSASASTSTSKRTAAPTSKASSASPRSSASMTSVSSASTASSRSTRSERAEAREARANRR